MEGDMSGRSVGKHLYLSALFVLLSTVAFAQSGFVGSEKCVTCHEKIYKIWEASAHYNAVQALSPANDTVIADWKGEIKLKHGKIPEITIKLDRGSDGSYVVTLIDAKNSEKTLTYTVARTQGDGWIKGQQYHVRIGGNYYVLPFLWVPSTSTFTPFFLDSWYDEDGNLSQPPMEKSWAMTCSGCHQTGMALAKIGDGYEVTYSDLSIGCEKCHGPGEKHIVSPEEEGNIINPRNLDYARSMDVCNQCHSVGNGKSVPTAKFGFPWDEEHNKEYKVGEPLTDYYRPVGGSSALETDEPIVLNTYHSLSKSKHYDARTTCFDCHDPHGSPAESQLVRADFNNRLCLYCHGEEDAFASPAMVMQHTKHGYAPGLSGASRCTGCHYIGSRRQKMSSDLPRLGRAAGFLGVVTPRQSLEMFQNNSEMEYINSCNRCHRDWGGDEAGYMKGVEAYESKFGL
jgi:predicted CXXCH cytochrome family protein